MPDARFVHAVQNEIREGDGINRVVLLASVKGVVLEPFQLRSGDLLAGLLAHVFKTLRQKTAGPTAWIVNRLADFRLHHAHHRPDDLARREELPSIVALLTHFQQQTLIDLRQREDVRGVHCLVAQFVNLVQHVAEILL